MKKPWRCVLWLAGVLLAGLWLAGLAGATRADGPVKKVLLIGLDGVRVDVMESADTPHLDALIAAGAYSNDARTRWPTVSGPGWSNLLTGVWPRKHHVVQNAFWHNNYDEYPDFLTRLEQIDPGFNTLSITDWLPLGTSAYGGPVVSDLVDVKITFNADEIGYELADALSTAAAVEQLGAGDPDAAFVYLGNIDEVGHQFGTLSPQYRAAIEEADGYIGELLTAIAGRPTYAQEDWLILVTTDHGRKDDGSHGGLTLPERRVFFLASGPSTDPGALPVHPQLVDVAVTALTHLGVAIDPAWRLDGAAIGLLP